MQKLFTNGGNLQMHRYISVIASLRVRNPNAITVKMILVARNEVRKCKRQWGSICRDFYRYCRFTVLSIDYNRSFSGKLHLSSLVRPCAFETIFEDFVGKFACFFYWKEIIISRNEWEKILWNPPIYEETEFYRILNFDLIIMWYYSQKIFYNH